MPSFGFKAVYLIDPLVLERPAVYTGGGSEYALARIGTDALVKVCGGKVARVHK